MTDSLITEVRLQPDFRVIRAQLLTTTAIHLANSRLTMETAQVCLKKTRFRIAQSQAVIARSECLERELHRLVHF